jgi:hypothetical protein
MAIVLFVVGLLATAAGFVTIGFGIPINAFSLGNTLIIAGSITVSTGLILIAMAAAIGQLRRIAELLAARAAPRPAARAAEPAEAAVPPTAKMTPAVAPPPVATRPLQPAEFPEAPEPRLPEPPQPEPRFPATATGPSPGPLDWLRAKPKVGPAAGVPTPPPVYPEPPVVEVSDEAPLSPRPPQRQAATPPAELTPEPKVWSPSRNVASEPRPAPRAEQPMSRATPQVEVPKNKDDFDLVWPDRGAAPPPVAEPVKREEPVAAKREPSVEMPMPPIPARPRESRPPVTPRPPVERGPAILKSGVIDGMPYTLYADGSIEAELSAGTVKFASVDALRAHLEKQS